MKPAAYFLILSLTWGLADCKSTAPATEAAYADTFFSAQALLDSNRNAQMDAGDTPLPNAVFIVTLRDGTEFGAKTNTDGKAFVTIPARVDYPVTLRMQAPEDSAVRPVEPSTVTLKEATGETIPFLFEQGR